MVQKVTKRLPSWASDVEESTLEQARRTSELPLVFPHLALMPDAHLGQGAGVGSVLPTLRAIVPAAAGVDIGCGMIAVRTQFSSERLRAAGRTASGGTGSPAPLREAIEAAAHGAGRRYSRSADRRTFSVHDLRTAMQGMEYRDTDAFVDEIPAAHKDIDRTSWDSRA